MMRHIISIDIYIFSIAQILYILVTVKHVLAVLQQQSVTPILYSCIHGCICLHIFVRVMCYVLCVLCCVYCVVCICVFVCLRVCARACVVHHLLYSRMFYLVVHHTQVSNMQDLFAAPADSSRQKVPISQALVWVQTSWSKSFTRKHKNGKNIYLIEYFETSMSIFHTRHNNKLLIEALTFDRFYSLYLATKKLTCGNNCSICFLYMNT